MNEEIKEILELYKDDDVEYYNAYSRLSVEEILDYITNLQEELEEEKRIEQKDLEIDRLNNIINITKNNIDITIQIIKEQPTGNDDWLLERLNGINKVLELKEVNNETKKEC